ncbi:hypothetical protein DMJ13_24370 [halophilic archaeon]|nr:hypothetical protein DMJ13_24370 [halophilic archaeon]
MADFEALRESFSDVEGDYAAWREKYTPDHRYHELFDLTTQVAGHDDAVLDVGAAPFHFTFLLDDAGYDVTGIDLDPSRHAAYVDEHALTVHACDIETEPFPLADNSVSVVLFSEVLEHLRQNPLHAMEEIERVLEPGGTLFLSTPNAHSIFDLYDYLLGGNVGPSPTSEYAELSERGHMGHVRHWATSEVRELLTTYGLTVVSVDYRNWHYVDDDASLKMTVAERATDLVPRLRRFQLVTARNLFP